MTRGSRPTRSALIPALLILCTAALYLPGLRQAQAYLSADEVNIALNARSVAATGRDLDGRFLPTLFYSPTFYVPPNGVRIWYLPILVYAVAIALKVMPFTETAIRLPLVIAAIVDVLLVYFICRILFERKRLAVLAAVLLALTPAHFIHARLALPAQISGPFVLGWLLCVLLYFRRHDPRCLFASGVLLGLAAIGYIGPLVAVYGLLTCIALYQRREPWRYYAAFLAGGLLPCVYFVWLLRDPAVVHEILGHYQQADTSAGLFARAGDIARVYWNFWSPLFLFVEGAARNARAGGLIGVFLLPVAGLLVVGMLRAVRRWSPESTLLLGGFFSAPLAASFVGEQHAIWRALEVAPFGVLLAAYGLEQFLAEDTPRVRWTVFVLTFAVPIYLAVTYHDYLVHAQPIIRALIVPMAVAGLAMLLRGLTSDPLRLERLAVVLGLALASAQVAYVAGYATLVNTALPILALVALAVVPTGLTVGRTMSLVSLTLLTLLASEFMYFHVDYPVVHRMGSIPASAVVLAMRLVAAAAVLPAVIGIAVLLRRTLTGRLASTQLFIAASLAIVVLQLAYFYVDQATDYRVRFVHVSAVLVLAFALAAVLSGVTPDRRTFARLGAVALFATACVQFGYFYVDYFTGYQVRTAATTAGNVRVVWEQVIEQARQRPVPAIFLGKISPYGDAGLYWRFYLIKHNREDLLARTIEGQPFERDRIRQLPGGSLLVASPSADVDRTIEQMEAAGEVTRDGRSLVRAPDGTPLFWVVERRGS